MCDWRPIDTAPKRGKLLLCRKVENPYRWPDAPHVRLKPSIFVGSWQTKDMGFFPATHWQPLPEPPR